MKKIKIGFLPLYIKLYDDSGSGARARPRLEPFYEKLAEMLEAEGIEVIRAPFCRIDEEFRRETKKFKAEGAEVIVTWHAAYSPSLESIGALRDADVDMFSTVFIGNAMTRMIGEKMVTPRGYRDV